MRRPRPLLPARATVLGPSAGGVGGPSALPGVSFVIMGGVVYRQ